MFARLIALLSFACLGMVPAAAAEYPPVLPRPLVFPADTGAHPDFRTEWWYATGWLEESEDSEGSESAPRVRGFQVTFFRVRTLLGEDNPSRFAPRQLILAHAAIADPGYGRLRHAERAERALAPLAGAAEGHTHVWSGDWFLKTEGEHYLTRVRSDQFAFELTLNPTRPRVLNGDAGFSQKAPGREHASYYYSVPQLAVSGTLELDGRSRTVTGTAWLDHEWSSEILPPDAQGWDWVGLNFDDGGSLMAFQMRGDDSQPIWGAATLVNADGEQQVLPPQAVQFTPMRRWQSPRTGADYPVEWQIRAGARTFTVQPIMDDQELDSRQSTGAVYWEGAVRVFEQQQEIGRGYLEMTGYAARLLM